MRGVGMAGQECVHVARHYWATVAPVSILWSLFISVCTRSKTYLAVWKNDWLQADTASAALGPRDPVLQLQLYVGFPAGAAQTAEA